jgi:hypothetical protein
LYAVNLRIIDGPITKVIASDVSVPSTARNVM